MRKIYEYVYLRDAKFNNSDMFQVREYTIREETEDDSNYYMFNEFDDGILKTSVDDWNSVCDNDYGKYFFSFKNDKETMLRFMNYVKDSLIKNLLSFVKTTNVIRIEIEEVNQCLEECIEE